jgi:hypothetical protein
MEHAINIAVMALVPLGVWVAMGEGMVLEWLHKLTLKLPIAIGKPLGTCARCMVTGWGVPAVLFLNAGDVPILALLAYIPAAVGLQELIDR